MMIPMYTLIRSDIISDITSFEESSNGIEGISYSDYIYLWYSYAKSLIELDIISNRIYLEVEYDMYLYD